MLKALSQPITVAVLGSGGREHALAKKIIESPFCGSLVMVPGNAGALKALQAGSKKKVFQILADLGDTDALASALKKNGVEFVVVGPDDLLAQGIVDGLEKNGLMVFGPTKAASKLEWSKAFSKEIMAAAGVPTAKHLRLKTAPDAKELGVIEEELGGYPLVLKYDGLALGKGVLICADRREAIEFLKEVFEGGKFLRPEQKNSGGAVVVAETFLEGHEISLFALCDGENFVVLDPACDHKRLLEGNRGPNTGGMGAFSPVPWFTPSMQKSASEKIFGPVLKEMKNRGTPFKGLLYAGLMVSGERYWVIEFNARFGDPETQALMPRIESDFLPLLFGSATGGLMAQAERSPLRWSKRACVNVVCASRGYPEKPETGFPLGLKTLGNGLKMPNVEIFYAGVKEGADGGLVTSGGRVLSVSVLNESLESARLEALEAAEAIQFEGKQHRKDIAYAFD